MNKGALLLSQLTLTFGCLFFALLTFYDKEFIWGTQTLLSLLLFMMACNNHYIYKRKYFTYIYLVLGLIFSLLAVMRAING